MATAAKTKTTFDLTCPECSASDTILIDLNNLGGLCRCDSCSEEFTVADARAKVAEQLKRWEKVARWIEMAAEVIAE